MICQVLSNGGYGLTGMTTAQLESQVSKEAGVPPEQVKFLVTFIQQKCPSLVSLLTSH